MPFEIETVTLPEHWASGIVNDDWSSFDDEKEVQAIQEYLHDHIEVDGWHLECPDEQEARFTWSYSLYDGGLSGASGGSVIEYTIMRWVAGPYSPFPRIDGDEGPVVILV